MTLAFVTPGEDPCRRMLELAHDLAAGMAEADSWTRQQQPPEQHGRCTPDRGDAEESWPAQVVIC